MSRTHWWRGLIATAVVAMIGGTASAAHDGKGHSADHGAHAAASHSASGHSAVGHHSENGHATTNLHIVRGGGGGGGGGHGGGGFSGGGHSGGGFSGGGHSFGGFSGGGSSLSRSFSSPSMSHSFSGGSVSHSFAPQSFSRGTSSFMGSNGFTHSGNLGSSHFSNNVSHWQSNHINSTWQAARSSSTWQQHFNDFHNGQNWNHNSNWAHNDFHDHGHDHFHDDHFHDHFHNGFFWWPVISWGSLWPWWYDNYYPADDYYTPYYYDYAPVTAVVTEPYAAQPYAYQSQYAEAPAQQQQPQVAQDNGNTGAEFYADAVTAFRNAQYKDALRMANHAAVESPQNPKAHELMSLSLFASGDYRGAAAEAHAALAYGPPASWETLYNYYGNDATYTEQLRALEKYSHDNPTAADARFLRAYQYFMTGHQTEAVDQLKEANKLAPQDRLTSELLKQYGSGGESKSAKPLLPPDPAPLPPPSGAAPVDKAGVDT